MKNIGSVDRIIRVVLGVFLISMIFWLNSSLKWIGLIGIIFLVTGIIGACPLYKIFGITTCKKCK